MNKDWTCTIEMITILICYAYCFLVDVLALAASIGELTIHTRKARTAMWCALQMSGKDVPQLRMLSASSGIPQPSLGPKPNASTTETSTMETTTGSDTKAEGGNDSNNNTTKSSA